DISLMRGKTGIIARIKLRELWIGRDRFVRFMEGHIKKEWLFRVAPLPQPSNRFAGDQRPGVALQRTNLLAIPREVGGIAVIRQGVVLGREPVRESMVRRLRLARLVEQSVEMPLTALASGVARLS